MITVGKLNIFVAGLHAHNERVGRYVMKAKNWLKFISISFILMISADSFSRGPPPGKGGGGGEVSVDHKAKQVRPIELGTSGGNVTDSANGYCCSGTLGSLITVGSSQYILSNAHVFKGDITSSGSNDGINQPGLIDNQCSAPDADIVAKLYSWSDLSDSSQDVNVDAAIAVVIDGEVNKEGRILEIGTISSTTVKPYLDQPVKKSGRTSGLTHGTVKALDATVNVGYSYECAGDNFTKAFTGQILVSPGKFIKGGDSGSLMVEDKADNPGAVGLLFAGSKRIAVANPIDDVLAFFGGDMVGGSATQASTTSTSSSKAPGQPFQASEVAKASLAKRVHGSRLLTIPEAVGHAVGKSNSHANRIVIKVLVEKITRDTIKATPKTIDGIHVELWEVGKITAY